MRILMLAFALAIASVPVAALAKVNKKWYWYSQVNSQNGNAYLYYGDRQAQEKEDSAEEAEELYTGEEPPHRFFWDFEVSCHVALKSAGLSIYSDIADKLHKHPTPIEISVGSAKTTLQGWRGVESEHFGWVEQLAVKPLIAVLSAPGDAIIKMGSIKLTFPDKGRADAVSEFAKTCTLD